MSINQINPEYYLILLFVGVFLLTFALLPRIRRVSLKFGFIDTPDGRSSHKNIVPTFGGIAFYLALILTLFSFQQVDSDSIIISLIASLSIMFFTGLKDDFQDISPRMKSLGQFISVGLIMFHSEFRITSLETRNPLIKGIPAPKRAPNVLEKIALSLYRISAPMSGSDKRNLSFCNLLRCSLSKRFQKTKASIAPSDINRP